jgi:hypothetical protein
VEILQRTIERLLKGVNSVDTGISVRYAGSVLSPVNSANLTIPYSQTEVINFSIDITCLGVSGPYQLYNVIDKVRSLILGKRVIKFDPLVSGIAEVASQFRGEVEPGKYGQTLVIEVKRPRTVVQEIC